ncbi:MAG: hypothetical protein WA231_06880 [Methylocella sp.]
MFDEMVDAFNRELPHYQIHGVRHPWGKYKSTKTEELRKIKKEGVTLAQTASYFSAYSISKHLIGGLEAAATGGRIDVKRSIVLRSIKNRGRGASG